MRIYKMPTENIPDSIREGFNKKGCTHEDLISLRDNKCGWCVYCTECKIHYCDERKDRGKEVWDDKQK